MTPSKTLIASILVLFLGACSSSPIHMGTYYEVLIDSFAPNANSGKTFAVLPGTAALGEDELRFNSAAGVLNRALTAEGLTAAPDAKKADLQIALFYEMKKESDVDDFKVPSYAKGIPGSLEPGRTIHSGLEKVVVNVIRQKHIRYVTVTALSRSSHHVIWETTVISRGDSDDLTRVAPILIAAGRGYYGKASGGRVEKTVWDDDASIRDLLGK